MGGGCGDGSRGFDETLAVSSNARVFARGVRPPVPEALDELFCCCNAAKRFDCCDEFNGTCLI